MEWPKDYGAEFVTLKDVLNQTVHLNSREPTKHAGTVTLIV